MDDFLGSWDHEDVNGWIQRFTMAKNVQYLNVVKLFKVKKWTWEKKS